MTYLKSIYVNNCYVSQHFEIDFSPLKGESFRHLILTGKNGTGKTTILKALDQTLRKRQTDGVGFGTQKLEYRNEFEPKVAIALTEQQKTEQALKAFLEGGLYGYLKVERDTPILTVNGPQKLEGIDLKEKEQLSPLFVQFLVNKKTEQAYAYQDGDQASVEQIEQWFNRFEQQLQFLFESSELRLEFNRKEFNFYIKLPKQERFDFNQLSHGYASVLSIITEILMLRESKNQKAKFSEHLPGIFLIDEIENHLHLALQEKILPFLTTTFPQIQFIVASHSPAVIASIDNATVYDLDTHRTVNEKLMGIPYHVLMRSHFGIESEYSLLATEKLKKAKILLQKAERTEQDNETLQQLAQELDQLSPDLSLEIFLELEHQKYQ